MSTGDKIINGFLLTCGVAVLMQVGSCSYIEARDAPPPAPTTLQQDVLFANQNCRKLEKDESEGQTTFTLGCDGDFRSFRLSDEQWARDEEIARAFPGCYNMGRSDQQHQVGYVLCKPVLKTVRAFRKPGSIKTEMYEVKDR